MRVKSLQLLCFKLANHKQKIHFMLDKYAEGPEDLISCEQLPKMLTDFSMIMGIIFM